MHPVLFTIGPISIFSYGVFILLGMIALFAIALNLGRQAHLKWEHLLLIAAGVSMGGVIGARLSHMLVEPDRLHELLNFYSLFLPGTPGNIIGLMIGGFAGGMVIRLNLDLPSTGNFYAPAMAAASVVWRIGCTLAGCCFGEETHLPWGIHLEDAHRHPTMIYEGLFNLLMLVVLLKVRPYFKKDNALLYVYFLSYAAFRFLLEFIRVYPPIAIGLTGIQFLCIAILLVLSIWFWRHRTNLGTNLPTHKVAL